LSISAAEHPWRVLMLRRSGSIAKRKVAEHRMPGALISTRHRKV
jgi:hypothetical protein